MLNNSPCHKPSLSPQSEQQSGLGIKGCSDGEGGCAGASIGVLAKIESADSVGNLEDILDAVDGAMVARGDLGAELPVEEVRSLASCMQRLS